MKHRVNQSQMDLGKAHESFWNVTQYYTPIQSFFFCKLKNLAKCTLMNMNVLLGLSVDPVYYNWYDLRR